MDKKYIENILNKIISDYKSVRLDLKKNKIDEPVLSSSFSLNLDKTSNLIFSEVPLTNDFKDIWKNQSHVNKKDKKVLSDNNFWEIDCFIEHKETYEVKIVEFKYGQYTLSDLLRSISMLIKKEKIKEIYLIFTKKPVDFININFDFFEIDINDKLFDELNSFFVNSTKVVNLKKIKDEINSKFNKNNWNWACLKITKKYLNNQKIQFKENFKNIESFTKEKHTNFMNNELFLDDQKNIDLKNIQFLFEEKNRIFYENAFEEIFGQIPKNVINEKNKNNDKKELKKIIWNSLFRKGVLSSFFKKDRNNKKDKTKNSDVDELKWISEINYNVVSLIINLIENEENKEIIKKNIFQNNKKIESFLNIFEIEKTKYENVCQNILLSHYHWSRLFKKNNDIKKSQIKDNDFIKDNTVKFNAVNRATDQLKQTIFNFIEKFNLKVEDINIMELLDKKINLSLIIKNKQDLFEKGFKVLYVLYFFAKIFEITNKIKNILNLTMDTIFKIDYFSQKISEINLSSNRKKIVQFHKYYSINWIYYFYLLYVYKTKNDLVDIDVFHQIIIDNIEI